MEILATKIELLYYCARQDEQDQTEIAAQIEAEIKDADTIITKLQEDLDKQKLIVKNKCEFEKVAAEISRYQSKEELEKQHNQLVSATMEIQRQNSELQLALDYKQKQAQLLAGIFEELRVGSVGA